jgi:hypothetical protein
MAKSIGEMTWDEFKGNFATKVGVASDASVADNVINKNWGALLEGTGKAAIALSNVGETGKEAAKGLALVANYIPGIGTTLNKFITGADDLRLANIKNAQDGLATGVLYGELNYKTQALGLTQDAYRKLLTDSGGSLNGLGMTADMGSKRLLSLGVATQEMGEKFIKNGNISSEQLARTTALSQYGSRVNLDNAETMKESAGAALALAKEIDLVVKVTGKNRDAIMGELEERLKSPVLQSALNVATEDQRQGIIRSQAQLSGMGKGVSDLSATLAINGRLTKEQQMQLQTLGPAAGEFQRASRMAALAVGEQQQKQAADAMVVAKAKIAEYQNSVQFANAMKNSTPEVAQYYKQAYQENQERGRVGAAMRETGMGAVGAQTQGRVLAGRDQEGVGADGKPLAERQIGKEITSAQYNAQIDAAGMGKQLSLLNIEMGKSPDIIEKIRTSLGKLLGEGGTLDQAAARYDDQRKEIFDKFRNDAVQLEKTKKETDVKNVLLKDPPGPITETSRDGGRAFGSKEATGSWFENFGSETMMKLHGPEAVVPQGKIGEFISDMMAKIPKPGGQQDQGAMPSMPSMPSASPMQSQSMDSKTMNDLHKQLVDLNTSIKDVATKMSNVSDNTAYTAKYTKAATGNRNA